MTITAEQTQSPHPLHPDNMTDIQKLETTLKRLIRDIVERMPDLLGFDLKMLKKLFLEDLTPIETLTLNRVKDFLNNHGMSPEKVKADLKTLK